MGVALSDSPSHDKLRGGYYTPESIASWLTAWAVRNDRDRVLEPSAGDGRFVSAVVSASKRAHVTALELDPIEAAKTRALAPASRLEVVVGDAFHWWDDDRDAGAFDCVIGNPPFIRYQHVPESYRTAAFALMHRVGLKPSKLTNAWLPFVVMATQALRDGGRLAMVLPAELLQVGYASELRSYLSASYRELTLVSFDELVFDGILQETVLLLGVRGDGSKATIRTLELPNASHLPTDRAAVDSRAEAIGLDHTREKWTQYYLTRRELDFLRRCEASGEFTRLGELASVDVGVVTGRNAFFVMTASEAQERGVAEDCVRMVGRSAQVPGLVLRDEDWQALSDADGRCYLLDLGNEPIHALSPAARAYVLKGEAEGVHTGYKCRIRQPNWWRIPGSWAPDCFMLRQVYDGPRIIRNRADATATDTLHRVATAPGVDPDTLAAASMNSLTWALAEVRGRSYGGGVLELEPSEAEALLVPALGDVPSLDDLDYITRSGGVDAALDEVDRLALKAAGLSRDEIGTLRGIWTKLATRRGGRAR